MSYFMDIILLVKGQIILKGLFDILEFHQKTNQRIRFNSKNEYACSFLGEFEDTKKSFRNYLIFTRMAKFTRVLSILH